ncbi:hypothetical protein CXG81DRAFT_11298 [Caulochytrium protostelioides]|uniref:Cullin-1 n=1 Tax=Caulochytrium protostelioides TaxID=1555241 RepID=A0A4P9WVC7_9FUNG|nr:Cullin-domain-containing protein [Caulochytrium protostelioides]RKP02007.1 hypothetical protein CXG81DRAFT_11298 [Caulochytrium protostelioides]|eukprot:RKP02007.1 hypothetical protein CXG81DRAFT_11298 [Caulochytrium protostelioides]
MGDIEATWAILHPGVDQILNRLLDGMSYTNWINMYTTVYNYCAMGSTSGGAEHSGSTSTAMVMGAQLYKNLRSHLNAHLNDLVLTAQRDNLTGVSLLQFYTQNWNSYTTATTYLNHIFHYLNRHWVKREIDEGRKEVYDIYTMSLVAWRNNLFAKVHRPVLKASLKLIEQQRDHNHIDTALIKLVTESFVSLGIDESMSSRSTMDVYNQYFDQPFLEATRDYYYVESRRFLATHSVPEYLKHIESRLAEESARVQVYLHPRTAGPLIKTCEATLIGAHVGVLQPEFQTLLDGERLDDLYRMYKILSRVPGGLNSLRTTFEEHVKRQGLAAVEKIAQESSDAAASAGAVDAALLAIHRQFSEMVQTCMEGEPGFVAALDKACRDFVNRNDVCKSGSSKSPELLAAFCDQMLRKSSKTEAGEIEETLNHVMTVFKYVEDKDVFQKFYSKALAKRLVNGLSASDDAEASMIAKLKEACGFEYTNKLQKMFQDMGLSKDLNDAFREQVRQHQEDQMTGIGGNSDLVDLNILVLGTASWPFTPPVTGFSYPDDLVKTYERFSRFFTNKHSGRKLNWLTHLSKGDLKTNCYKQKYTFLVSMYQMAVLLQYNNGTAFSWEELMQSTEISPDVLKAQIGNLLKARVLTVTSASLLRGLGEPGSTYTLNLDFKSKKIRVNLNMVIRNEMRQEADETHKHVEEDRKHLIQAAIVRIMKTRRQMKYQDLMSEVLTQLSTRFRPKVPDIKKCIDILLEKEYIERREGEKDVFAYVA